MTAAQINYREKAARDWNIWVQKAVDLHFDKCIAEKLNDEQLVAEIEVEITNHWPRRKT